MAVRVGWTFKFRQDNHLPRFRPTNSNEMDKTERKLARAFLSGIDEIPESYYRNLIFANMSAQEINEELSVKLVSMETALSRSIFTAYYYGVQDGAQRIRDGMNKKLRTLGSKARITDHTGVRKALDSVIWEPFQWGDIPPLQLFNEQPDNMAGKVYARFRSGEIISAVSADVQANVEAIISEGFTASQTFQTGRTVQGLTGEQTARRLYAVLQEVSAVPITGADYASFVAPHTNGLFPSWAKAVNRSMDEYATNLADKGVPPKEIKRRTDNHGKRYGNKLRRARARMIARTEIAYAQNRGIYDSFLKAQDDGLFGAETMKRWVVSPIDSCEICSGMGGMRVPLRQSFDWGTGGGDYPPAHPNCRCTVDLEPNFDKAPTFAGSGTLEDPHRYIFPDGYLSESFLT